MGAKVKKSRSNSFKYQELLLLLFLVISCTNLMAQTREDGYEALMSSDVPETLPGDSASKVLEGLDRLLVREEEDQLKRISRLQLKGLLSLQLERNEQALSAYSQALKWLDADDDDPILRIKVLCGLGQLAVSQGQEEEARRLFSQTATMSRNENFPQGLVWVFYHNGGAYLTGESYTKAEIEEIHKYIASIVYVNPRKAFKVSEWLIKHGGENYEDIHYAFIVLGLIYRNWGEMDKALEYFIQAQDWSIEKELPADYLYNAMLNITGVYFSQSQLDDALDIVLEVAEKAEKNGHDRTLAYALKDLGIINMQLERYEESEAYLLKAIPAMSELGNEQGVGVCHSNLVYVYLKNGHYDKSEASANLALRILKETDYEELYAATLLVKARLYMETDRWSQVKSMIREGLDIVKRLGAVAYIQEGYQLLARYYVHENNAELVSQYYDSLQQSVEALFDKERFDISENLKVRYETEKKETQLALQIAQNRSLAIENRAQRRQRNIFLVLALLFVILLVLLMNRYQLGKKLSIEKEARLQDQVRLSELENAQKKAENERLEGQVQHKQRELTSMTLQMAQKNDALEELEQSIKKNMSGNSEFSSRSLKEILSLIGNQKNIDKDWNTFKTHFDEVHPSFFDKLRTTHPGLSQTEEKHSAYIRMGLATKEIARLMNISPSSVQVSRYRLKKKMALGKEEDIYQYINSI